MAKRRIVLTSQEMNEINARTKTLESQLKRSNARVDELEQGLDSLKSLVGKEKSEKNFTAFKDSLTQLINHTINPPVKVKVQAQAEEALEEELE